MSIVLPNYAKSHISLLHFHTQLSQKLFLETLGSTGKYRGSLSEVFYKRSCSENGLENSQEITCAKVLFRTRGWSEVYRIFPVSFPKMFRENRFQRATFLLSWLQSGDFVHRRILSLFPVYLEWTKSSLRTTLIQNTRKHLLLEVAAM